MFDTEQTPYSMFLYTCIVRARARVYFLLIIMCILLFVCMRARKSDGKHVCQYMQISLNAEKTGSKAIPVKREREKK